MRAYVCHKSGLVCVCMCVCLCNSCHKILYKTSVIMINNSRFKVKDNYEGDTNNSSNEINNHIRASKLLSHASQVGWLASGLVCVCVCVCV